jgi:2'-5' RNA ligase
MQPLILLLAAFSLSAAELPAGWTEIEVDPASELARSLASLRGRINPGDLQPDAPGLPPHVTVRYGLLDNNVDRLRAYLASLAPFEIEFGPVAAFAPNESSAGAAPLFVEVESPALRRIYREIESQARFKPPDFEVYRPHLTLAFVKPAAVARYTGDATLRGIILRVKSITIVLKNGSREKVILRGRN